MFFLTTDQIREKWLNFFHKKGHYILQPKSLIPNDDPSLLWINSGVATLKKYFSGELTPPTLRLTNSQRAIRTNDIYNVGLTSRHHTFFEMLGSFAIGDYFKKEAIEFAYELLVKEFQMDPKLLYITVYEEDNETYEHWLEHGIDKKHIIKCAKNRNFWDLGQGPCGPCTEIFFDRGEKYDPKHIGEKLFFDDIENDRYVEIWNIVFSQFNNDGDGNYTELARKNIDTGAGLERLACVFQEVPTNFDTDVFKIIINAIQSKADKKYDVNEYFGNNYQQKLVNQDYRIIADHIKACVFAIADGEVPSAKERGSILRKLIRRAMVCAKRLGGNEQILTEATKATIVAMKHYYPYLADAEINIIKNLQKEQYIFSQTLERGHILFDEAVKNNDLNPSTIFKLVETFGFPFELIEELARRQNIKIDKNKFDEFLQHHKEISRGEISHAKKINLQNESLLNFKLKSVFDYDKLELNNSKVIGLFDEQFKQVEKNKGKSWLVFDHTVMYATSGGQVHDQGIVKFKNHDYHVIDVVKGPNFQHFICIDTKANEITVGDVALQIVDKQFRLNVARNHTSEHLIQYILQTKINKNIKQEGAFKSNEKVTFDFKYENKINEQQISLIELSINDLINSNIEVKTKLQTLDEAKKEGAIAYFDDVYAKIKDKLRVVSIGTISKEICGGTHVSNLSQIEQLMIAKITSKGINSWRIEAITSDSTIKKYIGEYFETIKEKIKNILNFVKNNNIKNTDLTNLIDSINYELTPQNYRSIQKQVEQIDKIFNEIIIVFNKQSNSNEIQNITNTKFLTSNSNLFKYYFFDDIKDSRNLFSGLINLSKSDKQYCYIGILKTNRLSYFACCDIEFANKNKFSCNDLIKQINNLISGSGGGKPTAAQGGTTNIELTNKVVEFVKYL